jgi:hypothetical protein
MVTGSVLVPALLNKISNFPPVRFAISAFSAVILSTLVTSRLNVSMLFSSRLKRDLVDRAVAKTRKPRAANSTAR